jgi:hypothetical protein
MWRIGWAPNNASRWQMGFNSVFKVLNPQSKGNTVNNFVTSLLSKILRWRTQFSSTTTFGLLIFLPFTTDKWNVGKNVWLCCSARLLKCMVMLFSTCFEMYVYVVQHVFWDVWLCCSARCFEMYVYVVQHVFWDVCLCCSARCFEMYGYVAQHVFWNVWLCCSARVLKLS